MIIVKYLCVIVFLSIVLGELKVRIERKYNKWEQILKKEMTKKLK